MTATEFLEVIADFVRTPHSAVEIAAGIPERRLDAVHQDACAAAAFAIALSEATGARILRERNRT